MKKAILGTIAIVGILGVIVCCMLTKDTLFDNVQPYKEMLYDLLSSDFMGYLCVIVGGFVTCLVFEPLVKE